MNNNNNNNTANHLIQSLEYTILQITVILHSVNYVFGVQLFSNWVINKNKLSIHALFVSMIIVSH
jgi:hypothetical protein